MDAPGSVRDLLAESLDSGRNHIGQIVIGKDYSLRHVEDVSVESGELKRHADPVEAREIARYDAEGNFRPLKTAPTLKRGWLLETGSLDGLLMALEFFYPASLGLWLSQMKGCLHPTPLRETLDRQTGMYRITQLLRDDQAGELVATCCNSESGCLRTILWELSKGIPVTTLPSTKLSLDSLPPDRIPLICRELCNLAVAAARPVAKGNLPKKEPGA